MSAWLTQLGDAWRRINEPPRAFRDAPKHVTKPLSRLWMKYFIRPHGLLLLVILATGLVGNQLPYVFVIGMSYLGDHVVEMQLANDAAANAAPALDPTTPSEQQLFALPDSKRPHENTDLSGQHDATQAKSTDERLRLLGHVSIAFAAAVFVGLLTVTITNLATIRLGQAIQFRLRQHVHDKLNRLPMSYHDQRSPGRLLTHLFSDIQVLDNVSVRLLRVVPGSLGQIAVGLGICFYVSPALTLWAVAALPTYLVCYHWFQKRLRNVARNGRELDGKLNAHVANRLSHFRLVKSFGRETREAIGFLQQARPVLIYALTGAVVNIGFVVVCGVIGTVCVTMVVWLSALKVRSGEMTPGELIALHGAVGMLFWPITQIANLAIAYHNMRYAATKVMRLLDEPIEIDDPVEDTPADAPVDAPTLCFENVTFRYGPHAKPALEGVSFTLPAGKRLAVLGASGSGKSTLAKVAARLYDPCDGEVRLGDDSLRRFKLSTLRKLLAFVPQEPIVFSGTIADNIAYGTLRATGRQVVAAAQFAQIHDYIHQLPERYRTLTHERGLTLSGGQKQRVSLARALMTDAKVLVLDDCTSALDAETESKLVDGFDESLEGRTTLIVTHRVPVAVASDYVLVLDGGRVKEFGPPQDLLDQGGAFAAMQAEQHRKVMAAGQPTPSDSKECA